MTTSGFRELIITHKALISYSNNWLVVRSYDDVKKIFLDELEVVIIENPACSITAYCAVEMARRNIKLIFCDERHNPISETLPLYGSYDCAAKLKSQIDWSQEVKDLVWQRIIHMKIKHQAKLLAGMGCSGASDALLAEAGAVKAGDSSNREGMAARIYFNALFGLDFNRQRGVIHGSKDTQEALEESFASEMPNTTDMAAAPAAAKLSLNTNALDYYNAALNYGYAILTSLFNRYIVAAGYSTQLGIFHRGAENQFNLSCDLMEPFRVVVDAGVLAHDMYVLDADAKHMLAKLIFVELNIDGACQTLDNAVPIYLRSVFDALNNGNVETILDYEL